MKASSQIRAYIKSPGVEGWRLVPYICPAGKWTVSAGHRLYPGEKVPGLIYIANHWIGKISEQTGEDLLTADLSICDKAIADLVKVPLNQNQHDALASFILNVGRNAFANSTLLNYLNQRLYGSAAKQLLRWTHGDHSDVLPGLVIRRQYEYNLFRKPCLI